MTQTVMQLVKPMSIQTLRSSSDPQRSTDSRITNGFASSAFSTAEEHMQEQFKLMHMLSRPFDQCITAPIVMVNPSSSEIDVSTEGSDFERRDENLLFELVRDALNHIQNDISPDIHSITSSGSKFMDATSRNQYSNDSQHGHDRSPSLGKIAQHILFFLQFLMNLQNQWTGIMTEATREKFVSCIIDCLRKLADICARITKTNTYSTIHQQWDTFLPDLIAFFGAQRHTIVSNIFLSISSYVAAWSCICDHALFALDLVAKASQGQNDTETTHASQTSIFSNDFMDDSAEISADMEGTGISANDYKDNEPIRINTFYRLTVHVLPFVGEILPQLRNKITSKLDVLRTAALSDYARLLLIHCSLQVASTAQSQRDLIAVLMDQASILKDSGMCCLILRIVSHFVSHARRKHSITIEEQGSCETFQQIKNILTELIELSTLGTQARCLLVQCLATCFQNGVEIFSSSPLISGYTKFIDDPCFDVRYQTANNMHTLLSSFTSSQHGFNEMILHLKPCFRTPQDENDLRARTACIALTFLACHSEEVERLAILELLRAHKSPGFIEVDFTIYCLRHVAMYLEYDSVAQMLENHLFFLLHRWINDNSIATFPSEFLLERNGHRLPSSSISEQDKQEGFAHKYGPFIVPLLVDNKKNHGVPLTKDQLDARLCDLLEINNITAVLEEFFVPIFAYWTLMDRAHHHTARIVLEQTVKNILGTKRTHRLIISEMDAILVEMLSLCSYCEVRDLQQGDEHLPYFSFQCAEHAFTAMAAIEGKTSLSEFLKSSKSRIHSILLNLRMKLVVSRKQLQQEKAFNCFDFVVRNMLRDCFDVTSVSRTILHIIKYATIHCQYAQRQACSLLLHLLDVVNEKSTADFSSAMARELGKQFKSIVTYAVNLLEKDPSNEYLRSVLDRLVLKCPSFLNGHLAELDPFPQSSSDVFSKYEQLYRQIHDSVPLFDQIDSILQQVHIQSSPNGINGISLLTRRLRQNSTDLLDGLTHKDEQIREKSGDRVSRLSAILFRLVAEYEDEHVKRCAVECIAELGLIFPILSDQNRSSLESLMTYHITHREFEFHDITQSITSEQWHTHEVLLRAKKHFLEMLNMYLDDDDIRVVRFAGYSIHRMLMTPSGMQAYDLLDLDIADYLQPFTDPKYLDRDLVSEGTGHNAHRRQYILLRNNHPHLTITERPTIPSEPFCEEIFSPAKKTHDQWIQTLAHGLTCSGTIVTDEVLRRLADMCLLKTDFAEQVFCFSVFDIAENSKDEKQIRSKISPLCEKLILKPEISSKRSIRLMISILNVLRRNHREKILRSKQGVNLEGRLSAKSAHTCSVWMDISFLNIARAAQAANAPYTAHLYIEAHNEADSILSALDSSGMFFESNAPIDQMLLLEVYSKIEEPDGLYGVNRNYGLRAQTMMYEHEGDYEKALGSYELLLQHSTPNAVDEPRNHHGLLWSLRNLGHIWTADMYMRGLSQQSIPIRSSCSLQELHYENAWRSCQWDIAELPRDAPMEIHSNSEDDKNQDIRTSDFHKSLFVCLKATHTGDVSTFWTTHAHVRDLVMSKMDSSVYSTLARLQILSDLANAVQLRWGSTPSFPKRVHSIPHVPKDDELKWVGVNSITDQLPYQHMEQLLHLRGVLLQILQRDDMQSDNTRNMIRLARKDNRLQLATNLIHGLSLRGDAELTPDYLFEEAKILWKQGESDRAVNTAKFLISLLDKKGCRILQEREFLSRVLCNTGKWIGQMRSESASDIIRKYLQRAVSLSDCTSNASKAHYVLAEYTDGLFKNIQRKLKSQEWKTTQELRRESDRLIAEYTMLSNTVSKEKSKYIARQIHILQKTRERDKEEDKIMLDNMNRYLIDAMRYYGLACKYGNKYDIPIVFRVCSLWFNHATDRNVNEQFAMLFKNGQYIASHKFLPLVYQIASRMGAPRRGVPLYTFHTVNMELLYTIARDHPHHTLFQLFALSNGDRISDHERKSNFHRANTDKVAAAKDLITMLSNSGEDHHMKRIIADMRTLIEAYLQLAFLPLDPVKYKNVRTPIKISNDNWITRVENLHRIPIATIDLPVSHGANYSAIPRSDSSYADSSLTGRSSDAVSFPSIVKFEDSFTLAGGINLPKIVRCHGSDGKKYRQLVKGSDDLRQDAVMEQMFDLVNNLLMADKATRKRNLRIRTYRVVPLAPTAGILGWVENTMPLAEYLVGNSRAARGKTIVAAGAHGRYRPKDMSYMECRKAIYEAAKTNNPRKKFQAFDMVCKRFKPVMHHFFLEKFPHPTDWFSKRLAYTRSVASSSIVGYIIGLGDRHAHNILIDLRSAEVVHIDLGVAFDQGKLLPTPETIPFRLTRDIVDGFGINGVEGVFRRCAEATMSVLRRNAELLCTIVEVFIHDPLYRWSLSPKDALNVQRLHGGEADDDDEVGDGDNVDDDDKVSSSTRTGDRASINESNVINQDAERALLRLKEKLQGYEEGELFNVKGQVNKLISQATDPALLSQLFHGWSSFM